MIIDESAYLQHYGVKGMKWGVRKKDSLAVRGTKKKEVRETKASRKADAKALKKLDRQYKATIMAVRDPESRMALTERWVQERAKLDPKMKAQKVASDAERAAYKKKLSEDFAKARATKPMSSDMQKKLDSHYKNPTASDLEDPDYYRWLESKKKRK